MFIYTTFVSSFEKYLDPKLTETAVTKANILKTVKYQLIVKINVKLKRLIFMQDIIYSVTTVVKECVTSMQPKRILYGLR